MVWYRYLTANNQAPRTGPSHRYFADRTPEGSTPSTRRSPKQAHVEISSYSEMIFRLGKDGSPLSPDEKPLLSFSMGFSTCIFVGGGAFFGVGFRYSSMNFWPFVFSLQRDR